MAADFRPLPHADYPLFEIPVAMLILISCVLEGKEVYYPQLIKRFIWRAHI